MRDRFILIGLGISAAIAGGLSLLASSAPDGLEKVAEDTNFLETAQDSATANSPLADYALTGVDGILGNALAGIAGVLATAVIGYGLFLWMKAPKS